MIDPLESPESRHANGAIRSEAESREQSPAKAILSPATAVLVVSSVRVARELIADTLEAAGFQVTAVSTAADAERFRDTPLGLLVLAESLTDERGSRAIRRWREARFFAGVPCLLLLSPESPESALAVTDAPVEDYLFTPIDRTELVIRARRIIKSLPKDMSDPEGSPSAEVERELRSRVSLEFHEPLLRTLSFAERLASRGMTAEDRASIEVLQTFLAAAQRLLRDRQNCETRKIPEDAPSSASGPVENVRIEPGNAAVRSPHWPYERTNSHVISPVANSLGMAD